MSTDVQYKLWKVTPKKSVTTDTCDIRYMIVSALTAEDALLYHPFNYGIHKYDPTDGKWKDIRSEYLGEEMHCSCLETWVEIPSFETLTVEEVILDKTCVLGAKRFWG